MHLGKRRTILEESCEVLKKTELSSRYALLLSQLPPKVGKLRIRVAEDYRKEWLTELAWLTKTDSADVVYPFCKPCKKICKPQSSYFTAQEYDGPQKKWRCSSRCWKVEFSNGFQWLLKLKKKKLSRLSIMHWSTATVDHVRLKRDSKNHGKCSIKFKFLVTDKFGMYLD